MGQQFRLMLQRDEVLAKEYAALGRTFSAQREFRQKWANDQYTTMKVEREKKEEHKFDLGEYGFTGTV